LQQCYRLWIGKARQGRASTDHTHRQLFWSNQPAATSIQTRNPVPVRHIVRKYIDIKICKHFICAIYVLSPIMVLATIIVTAKNRLNY
jgi:hypothetical protein